MENDPTYIPEMWTIYGLGMIITFARLAIRFRTVGLKGFDGDDYFSVISIPFWTAAAWVMYSIYFHGTNVEANLTTKTLTEAQIESFEYGSKLELVAWFTYTGAIWALKGCMLFLLHRLTLGLWQNKFIMWLAGACVITYFAVVLTITLSCLPFHRNWQVRPNPGSECTFRPQNLIVVAVLNVITDFAILCIPVPILWKLRVPLRRKIVVGVMLCSGVFVICAAIIRVVTTLNATPSTLTVDRWGFREVIVGTFTVNMPILRPIVSLKFWKTGHITRTDESHGGTGAGVITNIPGHNYEMASSVKEVEAHNDDTGSEDYIISPKGVTVERTFEVHSDEERGQTSGEDNYTGYHTNKAEVNTRESRS